MNADYYLENIVVEDVILFAPFMSPNFILIVVNVPPHMVVKVPDYLSPNFNPIEHLWSKGFSVDILTSHNQLLDVVIEEWKNVSQDIIDDSIFSMLMWMIWSWSGRNIKLFIVYKPVLHSLVGL